MDWVRLRFRGLVILISGAVVIYSGEYISGEVNFYRFLNLLLAFVLSMVLMIIRPNFVSILLGWDGLGLVSYCLVIYYNNIKSRGAGILTILSNRIGDVAILLGIA
jgi:NADH-ubiquinone oxidoreductase chain 5